MGCGDLHNSLIAQNVHPPFKNTHLTNNATEEHMDSLLKDMHILPMINRMQLKSQSSVPCLELYHEPD